MEARRPFLRLGLTGFPLGHSLSPRLHQAALAALHLEGEYALYPAPPLNGGAARLAELLEYVRQGRLDGLNVTIPHKQAVLPLLDELTPAARAIGAANTLYRRAGRLVGDNTDAPGFLADLERLGFSSPQYRHALVLGAGGAARAVCSALLQTGWQVTLTSRRPEQSAALAAGLCSRTSPKIAAVPSLSALNQGQKSFLTGEISLIINTTPVGMSPDNKASPWPEGVPLPASACLYDLVYNPAETALVRDARAAGLRSANGLGMLIEQAALAFQVWTGRTVPRPALWEALNLNSEVP